MKEITADLIKKLRDITGSKISISECKKILLETDGNIDSAVQVLIKQGVAVFIKSEESTEKLELKKPYKLSEIISVAVKFISNEQYLEKTMDRTSFRSRTGSFVNSDDFYLYTSDGEGVFHADTVFYLEQSPSITDDDEEIYPDFILKEGLENFCSGELFYSVIYNVLHQKNQASIDECVKALEYYLEHDSFLEL
ncbi:MAG: hypothetical protein FWG66_14725 [Spirochaetes bacterium]|nr:hypothetical protein [Spirochaetota bacterium]